MARHPSDPKLCRPTRLSCEPEAVAPPLGFEPEQAEPEAVAPPLGFNGPEQAEPEAVAPPLGFNGPEQAEPESPPQAFCPPVPAAPRTLARRPLKRPLPDSDPKPNPRENAPANFKRVHKAAETRARREAAEYAADQAELAERAERRQRETAERRALALQQIDSECRRCSECVDMDYLVLGPGADLMCSKHARRHSELVLRQTDAATAGAVSLA